MRRGFLAVAGAMTLLIAAACSDRIVTDPGRGLVPRGGNRTSAAGFTSVDEAIDGSGHCANGNPGVNCNIYDDKEHVWLNGGPIGSALGAGQYLFAVLAPSGQSDPNDGALDLLSSDDYTHRTFSVDAVGNVTYTSDHTLDGNQIRLMPYADTPNPGGVYIMAICKYTTANPSTGDGAPGVVPKDCKYDAFKVSSDGTVTLASDLTVLKDAAGGYKTTYAWNITKDVDKTTVK